MDTIVQVPAAHSMDSYWYAVDTTGEVARFNTGEPGAVPNATGVLGGEAAAGEETYALFYLRALAFCRHRDADDTLTADDEGASAGYVLVGFADLATDVTKWDLVTVFRGERLWAVSTGPVANARFTELEAASQIILGENSPAMWDVEDEGGITLYECPDYAVPGGYERSHRPDAPVVAAQLPDEVRKELSKLVLPVKFADQPKVQLADHLAEKDLSIWGEGPARGLPPEEREKAAVSASTYRRDSRIRMRFILAALAGATLLALLMRWLR